MFLKTLLPFHYCYLQYQLSLYFRMYDIKLFRKLIGYYQNLNTYKDTKHKGYILWISTIIHVRYQQGLPNFHN